MKIIEDINFHRSFNKENKTGKFFEFRDYGKYIHKKGKPYIFNRFYRSEKVKDILRTGLDLSITKELKLFHNGKIYVKSEHNKAYTFSVFLPIKNK